MKYKSIWLAFVVVVLILSGCIDQSNLSRLSFSSKESSAKNSWQRSLCHHLLVLNVDETYCKNLFHIVDKPPIQLPTIPHTVKFANTTEIKNQNISTKWGREFSDEQKRQFDAYFLYEIYREIRHTRINEDELSLWMNILSQNGSREGVYRALVLDRTYKAFEGYTGVNPSPEAIKFIENYAKKFLGKNWTTDKLKSTNVYTIKRIMSETALEIMDYYIEHNQMEHLLDWYSLFTSEMAKEYKTHFKLAQRQNEDPEFHKRWAKSVPLQYIKSEIVIKIHFLINDLTKT